MKNENGGGGLGARIREARKNRGLSQSALAEALGFKSATAISLIENGDRRVSVNILQRLSEVLHRDIKYFLGQDEKAANVQFALRADKDLAEEDRKAILRFIELAKTRSKRNGR